MITLTSIDNPASFHAEAQYQGACAVCGRTGAFDAHHVLERKHCKGIANCPLHSPDNALRLCSGGPERCHERHTNAQQRVPLACLRDASIVFVVRWLGTGPGYEYLRRYYSGHDPRLDALLEFV